MISYAKAKFINIKKFPPFSLFELSDLLMVLLVISGMDLKLGTTELVWFSSDFWQDSVDDLKLNGGTEDGTLKERIVFIAEMELKTKITLQQCDEDYCRVWQDWEHWSCRWLLPLTLFFCPMPALSQVGEQKIWK